MKSHTKLPKFTLACSIGIALALPVSAMAMTTGTIVTPGNNGVNSVYGVDSRNGLFGANLALEGCSSGGCTVSIDYLGTEAGNTNQFFYNSNSIFTTSPTGGTWNTTGSGTTATLSNQSDGLMDFSFFTNKPGSGKSVANGSNPEGDASSVNFFATFSDILGITSGNSVDLWFDDQNHPSDDDNHDDMAIRLTVEGGTISAVPVPATAWLFGSGLIALATLKRRKS